MRQLGSTVARWRGSTVVQWRGSTVVEVKINMFTIKSCFTISSLAVA